MTDFWKDTFSGSETLILSAWQCFSYQRKGTNAPKSARVFVLHGRLEKAQVLPSAELLELWMLPCITCRNCYKKALPYYILRWLSEGNKVVMRTLMGVPRIAFLCDFCDQFPDFLNLSCGNHRIITVFVF